MKTITIFTPTYNRAYTLPQLYNSLISQTNKDFIWLVIDDGSSDNTKELIEQWQKENKVEIIYIYQKNQGMHSAHNMAYKNINTELNVCIDSDDYMPNDAIEIILSFWKEKGNKDVAGIVGLDANKNGKIIGTSIPNNIKESSLNNLYYKNNVKGDKKLVLRTEVVKKYPAYPIFEEEKFVPLGYLYNLIDQDYKLLTLNKVLCIVEYLEDGSSLNILNQYRKNPKGFAFSRVARMKNPNSLVELIKNSIHYVSSSIFTKNIHFLNDSPKKIITFLVIPLGILLNFYIRLKTRSNE